MIELPYTFPLQTLHELLYALKKEKGLAILVDAQHIPETLLSELQEQIIQMSLELIILNGEQHQHHQYLIIIPEDDIHANSLNEFTNAKLIKTTLDNSKKVMDIVLMASNEGVKDIIIICDDTLYWTQNPYLFKLQEIAGVFGIIVNFVTALDDLNL